MTQREVINNVALLIKDSEKDLANMKVQEWVYLAEVLNPTKLSKREAEEKLTIYQTRIKNLEGIIGAYEAYIKEHNV